MSSKKAPAKVPAKANLGAGLTLDAPQVGLSHPAGSSQYGRLGQAERAFSAASTFLSGILAISASQFLGAPLKLVNPKSYDQYMAWTKENFAVLVSTMTQLWSPTVVRVTGDESMKEQLYQMADGSLRCNFPHRLVMMANHQLYTDWLYLWWIAYTNKMHGRIYIILKESLKNVPIFGWSAQFYNFIFLARKWETDRPRFKRHLQQLSNPLDPMWLLIFPEGTNLSAVTREKSKAWAEKTGVPDMKHQLLPRSTGLQFCLQELEPTTNWLYDCTIAYEGVPKGQFGQDVFTLRSSFFEGRPPKSVNMYWRRWRISDLPIHDTDAFAMWLRNRWTEKDYLLEHYARHGSFPDGDPIKAMKAEDTLRQFAKQQPGGKTAIKPVVRPAKWITTEVKAGGMEEFMGIFAPIASAATAISSGQLNPENIDLDALVSQVAAQQVSKNGSSPFPLPSMPKPVLSAPSSPAKQAVTSVPKTKNLDPELAGLIESAHAATQARLSQAEKADPRNTRVGKALPQARRQAHMIPVETLVTRPITSYAVNRGAGALARMGPRVGQAVKGANDAAAANGKPAAAKRPNGRARSEGGTVEKVEKVPATAVAAGGQAKHPLAGKTISKAEWERRKAAGLV